MPRLLRRPCPTTDTPRAMRALLRVLVLLLLTAALLPAGDGLYGPPDTESAQVRVFNAGTERNFGDIGPLRIGPLGPGELSPYFQLGSGVYIAASPRGTVTLVAGEGSYSTVVIRDGGLSLFTDERLTDPGRAQIAFYNLSERDDLSLRTADGAQPIIQGLAPGESSAVVVNPVSVELGVFAGNTRVASVGNPGLARGESVSIISYGPGGRGLLVQRATVHQN